jgi:hypothetical protein
LPGKLAGIKVLVVLEIGKWKKKIKSEVEALIAVPPLSKFGLTIEIQVCVASGLGKALKSMRRQDRWYSYRNGRFFWYESRCRSVDIHSVFEKLNRSQVSKFPVVMSSIGLRVRDVPAV